MKWFNVQLWRQLNRSSSVRFYSQHRDQINSPFITLSKKRSVLTSIKNRRYGFEDSALKNILLGKMRMDDNEFVGLQSLIASHLLLEQPKPIEMSVLPDEKQKKLVYVIKEVFNSANLTMQFDQGRQYVIGPEQAIINIDTLHALVCSNLRSPVIDCITLGYQQQMELDERQNLNFFSG